MSLENQELRKAGLKVTLPRVKIYQILEKAGEGDHFSAEDIYKLLMGMGEDVGLATVYRVLTQFEAAGLVSRHHFEGGHSVFELARDQNWQVSSIYSDQGRLDDVFRELTQGEAS